MTQHKIALITDSTCDIPTDLADRYGILVVPQVLIWGKEEFRDNINITPEEFYRRLAVDPVHPSTSQPVANDYLSVIEKVRAKGAEEIVIVSLSNALSGTLDSALQAAKITEDIPVHVHDSLAVSIALGFQVLAAARAREAGGGSTEMLAAARRVHGSSILYFSLDTLEYLHRGGRIGGAAKLIGTALHLKPMLMVDFSTGRVEAAERTRTRSKAIKRMVEVFFEQISMSGTPTHVAVLHGNALDDACQLEAHIRSTYNPDELFVTHVSPVIGVHTGPNALGLAGYHETN